MDLPLPPGRFGHTIRALDGRYVVLFGGCGNSGLYNDTWLLDMEAPVLAWRRVEVEGDRPVARVWHAACVVEGSKLVGIVSRSKGAPPLVPPSSTSISFQKF